MKILFLFSLTFLLCGCLGTPIKPHNVFETEESLSPYFLANKYFDVMERCWNDNNPDFAQNFQLETFPPESKNIYDIEKISIILRPMPTPVSYPPYILKVYIEEQKPADALDFEKVLIKTSSITVYVNDNIYPNSSLKWLDVKRWLKGDIECTSDKIELF